MTKRLAPARPEFLLAVGGSAAAVPTRIVDTHTHFYDPSRPPGVPRPPKNDSLLYRTVLPRHYQEFARPLGVSGTIVVEASPCVEDNQLPFDQPPMPELGQCPNVYAKVSGVLRRIAGRTPLDVEFYREALDELWALFGPDRLIYGSN